MQGLSSSNKKLKMIVVQPVQEQSESEIELSIDNFSDSMFGYGEFFYIDKKVDGMWYKPAFDDAVFKDFSALITMVKQYRLMKPERSKLTRLTIH